MQQRKMHQLAAEIVRMFVHHPAAPGLGVTVIVHAVEPTPVEWPMAIETTLPSRQHYRALFAEAIAASVLADGGDVDTAGDVASQDYNAVVGGRKPS